MTPGQLDVYMGENRNESLVDYMQKWFQVDYGSDCEDKTTLRRSCRRISLRSLNREIALKQNAKKKTTTTKKHSA